jgi:hypothetical protein
MNDINNISKCIYTCWHQHQTPNGCIFWRTTNHQHSFWRLEA